MDTTHTFEFHGLSSVSGLWPTSNYGEDVIIGILDPIFNDHGTTKVPSKWKGACLVGQDSNSTLCNRYLIGDRYFIKGITANIPDVKEQKNRNIVYFF